MAVRLGLSVSRRNNLFYKQERLDEVTRSEKFAPARTRCQHGDARATEEFAIRAVQKIASDGMKTHNPS